MKITDVTLSILRTELEETVIPTHGAVDAMPPLFWFRFPPPKVSTGTSVCNVWSLAGKRCVGRGNGRSPCLPSQYRALPVASNRETHWSVAVPAPGCSRIMFGL